MQILLFSYIMQQRFILNDMHFSVSYSGNPNQISNTLGPNPMTNSGHNSNPEFQSSSSALSAAALVAAAATATATATASVVALQERQQQEVVMNNQYNQVLLFFFAALWNWVIGYFFLVIRDTILRRFALQL